MATPFAPISTGRKMSEGRLWAYHAAGKQTGQKDSAGTPYESLAQPPLCHVKTVPETMMRKPGKQMLILRSQNLYDSWTCSYISRAFVCSKILHGKGMPCFSFTVLLRAMSISRQQAA
jgi:hypothetical protein